MSDTRLDEFYDWVAENRPGQQFRDLEAERIIAANPRRKFNRIFEEVKIMTATKEEVVEPLEKVIDEFVEDNGSKEEPDLLKMAKESFEETVREELVEDVVEAMESMAKEQVEPSQEEDVEEVEEEDISDIDDNDVEPKEGGDKEPSLKDKLDGANNDLVARAAKWAEENPRKASVVATGTVALAAYGAYRIVKNLYA